MEHSDRKLQEIVERYRTLAAEAQCAASSSAMAPNFKVAYSNMARHWSELASELEETFHLPSPVRH